MLLINVMMPTYCILTFISMINVNRHDKLRLAWTIGLECIKLLHRLLSKLQCLVMVTVGGQNLSHIQKIYGPRREKTCLRVFANNTGADQPAHPRSLISAFVIRVL